MPLNTQQSPHPGAACSEPDGNEVIQDSPTLTAHALFIRETGQCPWCGEEGEYDALPLTDAAQLLAYEEHLTHDDAHLNPSCIFCRHYLNKEEGSSTTSRPPSADSGRWD